MMNKLAVRIQQVLGQKNGNDVTVEEKDDCCIVALDISLRCRDRDSLRMEFITRDESDKVIACVRLFERLTDRECNALLPEINKYNARFRFLKFYPDEGGNVMAKYSFHMMEKDPGDSLTELIRLRFVPILSEVYPGLKAALKEDNKFEIDDEGFDFSDFEEEENADEEKSADASEEQRQLQDGSDGEETLYSVFSAIRFNLIRKGYRCDLSRIGSSDFATLFVHVDVDGKSDIINFFGTDMDDLHICMFSLLKLPEEKQRECVRPVMDRINAGLQDMHLEIDSDNDVNIVYECPGRQVHLVEESVDLVQRFIDVAADAVNRMNARLESEGGDLEVIREALAAGGYQGKLKRLGDCGMLTVPLNVRGTVFDVDFFRNAKQELSVHLFGLVEDISQGEWERVQDALDLLEPMLRQMRITCEASGGNINITSSCADEDPCEVMKRFSIAACVVRPVIRAELRDERCN